jgi:hypothetical protein
LTFLLPGDIQVSEEQLPGHCCATNMTGMSFSGYTIICKINANNRDYFARCIRSSYYTPSTTASSFTAFISINWMVEAVIRL